ncbi:hypothetical protein N8K70_06790 [Microbacterium betulae]|uniref:Uncharacterized protein n=1 Tax=Microbacterium betulae TaxID=2981139 RepID=A0AA97FJE5_9MICO|nr:hypothetical protein [Microbacterium sp. AB]WOF24368.1 hypothetical protein N8K70_06790 [Microbacterium sp. AB]
MKKPAMIALAGAGVIAAGALVVGFWLFGREPTAEDVAERYLDALVTGDADGVRAVLADTDAVPEQTWSAFEGASAHLGEASLTGVETTEDTARARAAVTLDGEAYDLAFDLTRTDAGGWRLDEAPLTEVAVSSSRGTWIGLDGEPVALDDGTTTLSLLPGSYTVAGWPSTYLEGEALVLAGVDAAAASVEIDPSFTEQAQADAEAQLTAYLEGCLEPADDVDPGCGMVVPWPVDLAEATEVVYRADAMPDVAVDLDAGTFDATGGSVVATVRGVLSDGTEGEFSYRTDDWSVYGAISADGEGLLLSVY